VDTFKYGSTFNQTYAATACGTAACRGCPRPELRGHRAGNIDADVTVDQWSISSNSRVFTAAVTARRREQPSASRRTT